MEISDLTDEQINSLTREQANELEEHPERLEEILGKTAKPKDEPKPEQEEQDGAANGAGKDDDEEEPVVLNKSGKGIIPYSTVQGLRVENATLKEQFKEAQQRLEELMQQKEEAGSDPEAMANADAEIASHLDLLKEDMPEVYQVLNAVVTSGKAREKKLEEALSRLQKEREEAKEAKEKSIAEQVAEATENNADLVHWRENDQEAWEEAIRQDENLRLNAKWREKSFDERFAEAVRRVRAIMPEAAIPKKPKSAEETRAAAKAKLEEAPARQPTTLSDFQGGRSTTSPHEELASLSNGELTARLMKMPREAAAAMRADLD